MDSIASHFQQIQFPSVNKKSPALQEPYYGSEVRGIIGLSVKSARAYFSMLTLQLPRVLPRKQALHSVQCSVERLVRGKQGQTE